MIKVDMWYNDKKEQATGLDIQFNDLGCFILVILEFSVKWLVIITPTACKKFVKRSHIWKRK